MGRHGHPIPMEVMGTMIEMADVAWNALEHHRDRKVVAAEEEEVIVRLHSENHRLKSLLSENVHLLHDISRVPSLVNECPSDLYSRLIALVESPKFLRTLESLNQEHFSGQKAALSYSKDSDQNEVDATIQADDEKEVSYWVLLTHDMAPYNLEEVSGIDDENYVILSTEDVVDGIANFMARCIFENPKSTKVAPEELKKAVSKALADFKGRNKLKSVWDAGMFIYTLSTWGILLAGYPTTRGMAYDEDNMEFPTIGRTVIGDAEVLIWLGEEVISNGAWLLYRHRNIVKAAAKGIHGSAKFVLKAL